MQDAIAMVETCVAILNSLIKEHQEKIGELSAKLGKLKEKLNALLGQTTSKTRLVGRLDRQSVR